MPSPFLFLRGEKFKMMFTELKEYVNLIFINRFTEWRNVAMIDETFLVFRCTMAVVPKRLSRVCFAEF